METKKIYNQQAGIARNVAAYRNGAMMLLALLFLFGGSLSAQTYYNDTNTTAPSLLDGITVTMSNTGTVDSNNFSCGGPNEGPYFIGGASAVAGSYTWSFSASVQAVRMQIDGVQLGDTITVQVNGAPYFITSSNVNSFGACIYGTTFVAAGNGAIVGTGNSSGEIDITGMNINSLTLSESGGNTIISNFAFATDNAPTFDGGSPQYASVCQNGGAYDVTSFLSITDLDAGQTETWSVVTAPSFGFLGGFPYDTSSTGGDITPSGFPTGLTYTPGSGFAGNDSFVVEINDGAGGTAMTTIYVSVNPTPTVGAIDDTSLCNGTNYSVTFSGTLIGENYNWVNDNAAIGLATSGSGGSLSFTSNNITTGSVSGDITVTPTENSCNGAPVTFTVTVYPTATVNAIANQNVCSGVTDSVNIGGPVTGAVYTWDNGNTAIGLASSGTGNITPFTTTNGTSGIITSTVSVTPSINGCEGTATSFVINVNPVPYMDTVAGQTLCNGFPTTAVTFNDTVDGASYSWTNSNTDIGLDPGGTGNIGSFTATDVTSAPISGTIAITPSANGCAGPTTYFVVTVNPTPLLASSVSRYTVCNNTAFNDTLSSATTGAGISWSRDAVAGISNGPASGSTIIGEMLSDTTADTAVATYVVSLNANGCSNIQNINVTVSPTPMLSSALTIPTVCDNSVINYTPLSNTAPVYFSWERDTVANVSPGSNVGTGSVSETLVNGNTVPVVVTYLYTLDAYGCTNTQSVTVTVNPNPMLSSSLTPPAICDSTAFYYIGTSSTPGTTITWSRAVVAGITNASSSGVDSVNEVLVNTTTAPVLVTYVDTLNYEGCYNIQDVMVYVNQRPTLTSSIIGANTCNGTTFTYAPESASSSFSSSWSRAAVAGISNAAASGVGTISEILNDTTALQVVVVYMDTLTANGCINIEGITDTVNPTPALNTQLVYSICDSALFNYIPNSNTPNVGYTWVRNYEPGILEAGAGSSSINPNEQLINTTNFEVVDTYAYTLSFEGCTNAQNVIVMVQPTPLLTSSSAETICSGVQFEYVPASSTPDVTFAWARSAVAGISPANGSGADTIRETLVDSLTVPVQTVYDITMTINGCHHSADMTLNVNPTPASPAITVYPPNALCDGTFYQNFGTVAPAAGVHYNWNATNAEVYAEGVNKQYALVNFDHTGTAVVTLRMTADATSCANNTASYTVTVGENMSSNPTVIYVNGQFICLMNGGTGNDTAVTYQWGYDDAIYLDSTALAGQVNQVYFNNAPDFTYRYYWVMTTNGGCSQKSYYNAPLGVASVNNESGAELKVFPNPASDNVNVEISSLVSGNVSVEILNLLGQKLSETSMINGRASINVASVPSGCYIVNCYRDGSKLATAKFIKN